MTTDDFTKAARAYAEQACYQDENRRIAEAGFRAGWKAARTYLAAQEPTDAEVETAARAMRIETLAGTVRPGAAARWWDNGDVSPDEADKLRRLARAALSAARAARRDEETR